MYLSILRISSRLIQLIFGNIQNLYLIYIKSNGWVYKRQKSGAGCMVILGQAMKRKVINCVCNRRHISQYRLRQDMSRTELQSDTVIPCRCFPGGASCQ